MKNSKLKFSEYKQNISRSKSFWGFEAIFLLIENLLGNYFTLKRHSLKNVRTTFNLIT